MPPPGSSQKDAYQLLLEAIDQGDYRPGDRLVESELAERFGVSRTPIREALQRLETQGVLARDGRSLVVSRPRSQPAGRALCRARRARGPRRAARRPACGARGNPRALGHDPARPRDRRRGRRSCRARTSGSTARFISRATTAISSRSSRWCTARWSCWPRPRSPPRGAAPRRSTEHEEIVRAIEARDGAAADAAIRSHISRALETRLMASRTTERLRKTRDLHGATQARLRRPRRRRARSCASRTAG